MRLEEILSLAYPRIYQNVDPVVWDGTIKEKNLKSFLKSEYEKALKVLKSTLEEIFKENSLTFPSFDITVKKTDCGTLLGIWGNDFDDDSYFIIEGMEGPIFEILFPSSNNDDILFLTVTNNKGTKLLFDQLKETFKDDLVFLNINMSDDSDIVRFKVNKSAFD